MTVFDERLIMPARTYLTFDEYQKLLAGAIAEDRTVSNYLRHLIVTQLSGGEVAE